MNIHLQDAIESEKKIIYYIKIHAPWDVLCFYAEDLSMRAPLQVGIYYYVHNYTYNKEWQYDLIYSSIVQNVS